MNDINFRDKLREELIKRPGFGENRSHFITFCPNCEKYRDRTKHGHLYINKIKKDYPGNCKKCDLSFSKLNIDILSKLDITNINLTLYVKENFKSIKSHIINLDERNKKLDYRIITNTSRFCKMKLSVLSDRLLHDFDNENDLKTYRIVTNLSNFIYHNHIDMNNFNQNEITQISLIDKYYIGFLSYYGNLISFRNMTGDKSLPRYITFSVSKELRRSFFYTPVCEIDPLTPIPKITVGEGAIDIISIHLNNKCYDENNNMYAASSSIGSFRSTIKECLYITGFFGCEIQLFLDNDERKKRVSDYDFGKIIHSLHDFEKDFKLTGYINLSSKDFGDMREKITIGKVNLNQLILQQ